MEHAFYLIQVNAYDQRNMYSLFGIAKIITSIIIRHHEAVGESSYYRFVGFINIQHCTLDGKIQEQLPMVSMEFDVFRLLYVKLYQINKERLTVKLLAYYF